MPSTPSVHEETGDVQRILVVTAHPDDVDFGAGGTVATWTRAGIEVAYCICTDGDAGGFDDTVPRDQMAGIRQAEQRAAAAALGVEDVTFLGYADGRLEVTLDLRRDIARQIRRVRPDRVVVQSPVWSFRSIYRSHPDHRAAGEAAMAAVYPDARNPYTFTELLDEGLVAHAAPETWIMVDDVGADPVVVDVTDTIEAKLEALRCHASQHPDVPGMEERIRSWMAHTAETNGLGAGRFAETFSRIDTR